MYNMLRNYSFFNQYLIVYPTNTRHRPKLCQRRRCGPTLGQFFVFDAYKASIPCVRLLYVLFLLRILLEQPQITTKQGSFHATKSLNAHAVA